MKKILILCFVLIICFTTFSYANTFEEMKIEGESVSVRIQSEICNEIHNICTGVVLTNDYEGSIVLTARHCISMQKLYVEKIPVEMVYLSKNEDLALLILKKQILNKKEVKLPKEMPVMLDSVYVFGFPKGQAHFSIGQILNVNKSSYAKKCGLYITTHRNLIQTTVPAIKGCSGGGLFNKNHELIGINVSGSPTQLFSVSINSISLFLESLRQMR